MIYCPTCGAGLKFDIASQKMVCDQCRNSYEPETLIDRSSNDAKTEAFYDSYAYICPSCGAEIDTTDKNDAVGFCPYCGGASMIYDKLRRDWKPEGIVPFRITKEQCKELYCNEVRKHIFVSKKYCDPELIEGFRGIYMPYISFKGVIEGDISLRAQSEEKDIGNYDYQTLFYDLRGKGKFTAVDINSQDASAAFDDHISERLLPYDERYQRAFHPAYLSGFYAESGNIDINEYGPVVWNEMQPYVCREIGNTPPMQEAATHLGVTVKESSEDNYVPMRIETSNRKLFPVWFMSYRRGEKITYAAVNGQTGKVAADLPLSPLKILAAALIISGVIFGLFMIAMNFLPTIPASATLGVCTLLGFGGMYLLQHSYIRTIGFALHQKELTKKFPVGYIIWTLIAAVGIILLTTDGTYEQDRAAIGFFMSAVAFFVLLVIYFISQSSLTKKIKKIQLSGVSMHSNGILVEAKKFGTFNTLMRTIMFITLLLFIPAIVVDVWNSAVFYMLAAVSAVELFILALMHIVFQSGIAKHKLPQFNKKGAAYDEK